MSESIINVEEYLQSLTSSNLKLDDADKEVVKKYGNKSHYVKDQLVFDVGDKSSNIYLIEKGWLNIGALMESGKQVTVAFRKTGDVVGLAEALYGGERTCFAQAMSPLTLISISSKDFKEILHMYPILAIRISELLGSRLREAHSMIHEVTSLQAPARIALLLIKLGESNGDEVSGGSVKLNLKLTHEEIARMLATSRQTVTTVLNNFKQEESIICKGRAIDSIHPQKLLNWVN